VFEKIETKKRSQLAAEMLIEVIQFQKLKPSDKLAPEWVIAKEMKDVVHTLESFELPSDMAKAMRDKLSWCSSLGLRELLGGEMPESIDQAIAAILRSIQN